MQTWRGPFKRSALTQDSQLDLEFLLEGPDFQLHCPCAPILVRKVPIGFGYSSPGSAYLPWRDSVVADLAGRSRRHVDPRHVNTLRP